VSAKLTWSHNVLLISKVKDLEIRKWYMNETIKNGWSKDINKPVGVSEYKLLQDIPEYLQSQLPKAEDIELHIKDIEEIEEQEDNKNSN
jgi:predicted nuclease of restriction endonuclease-like (RecB) superfamily